MSAVPVPPLKRQAVVYPESDGKPMADNSKQFRWIVTLAANLAALFDTVRDVLVGGNMFWYPVEGEPEVVAAPDVFVVFGRPKGDRGSYRQWEEAGVPMTAVFEVLSPGNGWWEMDDKLDFYEQHGVEEYYLYDPDTNRLKVFLRRGEVFRRVHNPNGFVSPRLGIRFDLSGPEMAVHRPDGERFLTFEELARVRDQEKARADAEKERADREHQRAERLAARLRELGIDPENGGSPG